MEKEKQTDWKLPPMPITEMGINLQEVNEFFKKHRRKKDCPYILTETDVLLINFVLDFVAKQLDNLTPFDIQSRSHKKQYVLFKRIVAALLIEYTKLNRSIIGSIMGQDWSGVYHKVKMNERLSRYEDGDEIIKAAKKELEVQGFYTKETIIRYVEKIVYVPVPTTQEEKEDFCKNYLLFIGQKKLINGIKEYTRFLGSTKQQKNNKKRAESIT